MKYKIGDKVRIKSIDWYNKNKDEYGYVRCIDILFTLEHSKYCGKVMTISHVRADHYTMVEDLEGYWTDEMIECKVKEETKPKYEDEVNGEYYSTPKYLVRPSGYQFVDENGNVINATV